MAKKTEKQTEDVAPESATATVPEPQTGTKNAPLVWSGEPFRRLKEILKAQVPEGQIRTPRTVAAAISATGVFPREVKASDVTTAINYAREAALEAVKAGEQAEMPEWLKTPFSEKVSPITKADIFG